MILAGRDTCLLETFTLQYFKPPNKMQPANKPISIKDRSEILDILRGIALAGVMIDNLFAFTGWGFQTMQQRAALPTWPVDGVLGVLEQVFINGKFYSIFSLLFGIGFTVIVKKNEGSVGASLSLFYRRLFILLIIGAIHIFLIWEGDILFLYALIGMLLPIFMGLQPKRILALAIILLLSPLLLDVIFVLFKINPGAGLEKMAGQMDMNTGLPTNDQVGKYLYGPAAGWKEWRNWQHSGWLYRIAYLIHTNRIPKVLGMFLLGLYAGKKMMYVNLSMHKMMFRKMHFWGLLIGIPAAAACTYFELLQPGIPKPIGLAHTFFYAISVVPLALAYVSIICLRWEKRAGKTRLALLAPMGRMALTNYLVQTFFGIFLYYGVGLNLGGDIGPTKFILIGLLVYAFQLWYSRLWLTYFNYGPCEWIWRQLTYGKRLPLRKQAE